MQNQFGFPIFDMEIDRARAALSDCLQAVNVTAQTSLVSARQAAWRAWATNLDATAAEREELREAWKAAHQAVVDHATANGLPLPPEQGPSLWEAFYCRNNPAGNVDTPDYGWNNRRTNGGTCF